MSSAEPLAPGSRLGGFLIGDCVHQGAHARLYRVQCAESQADPGCALVLKQPRTDDGDAADLRRFEVEHQTLRVLSGPHVPRLLDAEDAAQPPWLVMEAIEGASLQQRLDQPALPAVEEVVGLGVALAQAVHGLHQQHGVHLGLRPDRVRLTNEGRVVLLGYGLSWHAHHPDLHAGLKGAEAGEAGWMAPEQLLGVRGDPRSDIFALGAILYQLLTHELPHGLPDSEAGLRQRLWREPPPPRRWRPEIPAWLQEVLLRCLAPEPAQRYPSAAHLAFDLRHPQQVRVTARSESLQPAPAWTQWRRWWRAQRLLHGAAPAVRPARVLSEVPIVLLAVPPEDTPTETLHALRRAALRVLGTRPGARLACVTVLVPTARGDSLAQRRQLAALQRWAQGLEGPGHQTSCHVLMAPDVATALLDWAQRNAVSDLVLGAGAVASEGVAVRVARQAACNVQLVRAAPGERLTG
ncbi:MAG: protein kinase [Hylemonella sp.]|uniref:serine/threonine protein kinase n=1 Tax=Hylemonella sp. TaxID=2066020 RepID=UPI0022C3C6A2|nr:protein kinase [Hylemonella sp.]MCZ8253234.1 protein kinase [Hylemonella sp.]